LLGDRPPQGLHTLLIYPNHFNMPSLVTFHGAGF
jgi:hypothetical protein